MSRSRSTRVYLFVGFVVVLTAGFSSGLYQLFSAASGSELNSYILLIPITALYLLYVERSRLPRDYSFSLGWALLAFGLGAVALIALHSAQTWRHPLSSNDRSSLLALAYVSFVWSGALLFLGRHWFTIAVFPMLFLVFIVPLPDNAVNWLENGLGAASADAAEGLFALVGVPALREGMVFQLPNISLEVAHECSGIRSSWVLLITSIIASYLFLSKRWSQVLLIAAVIPLGILRNGFRIMVIGWLCVNVRPQMINSPVHRQGGPLFFALSLIPFGLVLWMLRRRELAAHAAAHA